MKLDKDVNLLALSPALPAHIVINCYTLGVLTGLWLRSLLYVWLLCPPGLCDSNCHGSYRWEHYFGSSHAYTSKVN